MNTATSIQPLLEEALEHLPLAAAGNDDSVEAALLAQANAMALIFREVAQAALRGEPVSRETERGYRLATNAGAQSGRLLLQLVRLKKMRARASARPAAEPFRPPSPEEVEAGFQRIKKAIESGQTPAFEDVFLRPGPVRPAPPSSPAPALSATHPPPSNIPSPAAGPPHPTTPAPPPPSLSTLPAVRGFC